GGLPAGGGVGVRAGGGVGVRDGVGLAVCGVMALGNAESARPTGAGVAAPPHVVSPPRITAPAKAPMIRRDRISFRVLSFVTSRLSLRDRAVPFEGGGHRPRSNWV